MNISKVRCTYCHQPRDFSADLHGCEQSRKAMAYLSGVIGSIKANQERPGIGEQLSLTAPKAREDRRREYASSINIIGGGLKPRN